MVESDVEQPGWIAFKPGGGWSYTHLKNAVRPFIEFTIDTFPENMPSMSSGRQMNLYSEGKMGLHSRKPLFAYARTAETAGVAV